MMKEGEGTLLYLDSDHHGGHYIKPGFPEKQLGDLRWRAGQLVFMDWLRGTLLYVWCSLIGRALLHG